MHKRKPTFNMTFASVLFIIFLIFIYNSITLFFLLIERPLTKGSIHAQCIDINNRKYLIISGDSSNYNSQFQSIVWNMDYNNRTIQIKEYWVRICPNMHGPFHNDWPIVIDINDMLKGDIMIKYNSLEEKNVVLLVKNEH